MQTACGIPNLTNLNQRAHEMKQRMGPDLLLSILSPALVANAHIYTLPFMCISIPHHQAWWQIESHSDGTVVV